MLGVQRHVTVNQEEHVMSTQVRAAQDVQQDGLVGVVKVSKEGIFFSL